MNVKNPNKVITMIKLLYPIFSKNTKCATSASKSDTVNAKCTVAIMTFRNLLSLNATLTNFSYKENCPPPMKSTRHITINSIPSFWAANLNRNPTRLCTIITTVNGRNWFFMILEKSFQKTLPRLKHKKAHAPKALRYRSLLVFTKAISL